MRPLVSEMWCIKLYSNLQVIDFVLFSWKHKNPQNVSILRSLSTLLTSLSGRLWSSSFRKSMSLEEIMPTSLPPILPLSVMGMPQKPWRALAWKTSRTRSLGLITTGSVMKPCSYRWMREGWEAGGEGKQQWGSGRVKLGTRRGGGEGNTRKSRPILYS